MIWLVCHAMTLFWKVRFPFRARYFSLSKKDKYLHIASLLAGFLLPVIPIVASIADSAVRHDTNQDLNTTVPLGPTGLGFGRALHVGYSACYGTSAVAIQSIYIPLSIMVPSQATFIILVCYYIHKVHVLYSRLCLPASINHNLSCFRSNSSSPRPSSVSHLSD